MERPESVRVQSGAGGSVDTVTLRADRTRSVGTVMTDQIRIKTETICRRGGS